MLPTLRSVWQISERRGLSWSKRKDYQHFIPLLAIFLNNKDESLWNFSKVFFFMSVRIYF